MAVLLADEIYFRSTIEYYDLSAPSFFRNSARHPKRSVELLLKPVVWQIIINVPMESTGTKQGCQNWERRLVVGWPAHDPVGTTAHQNLPQTPQIVGERFAFTFSLSEHPEQDEANNNKKKKSASSTPNKERILCRVLVALPNRRIGRNVSC
jgi:hypothetical protein